MIWWTISQEFLTVWHMCRIGCVWKLGIDLNGHLDRKQWWTIVLCSCYHPKKTMELQTCTNKCSSRKNVQKGQTTTCWQNVQIQPNVQTSSFRWLAVKNLDHLVATTVTFCAQFGANERNFKEYPSWVCQPFQPTFKLRAPSCKTRSNLAAAQKFRKCAHFHISKRTESCVRVMYEVCIYI
jgi:hypothetical protein